MTMNSVTPVISLELIPDTRNNLLNLITGNVQKWEAEECIKSHLMPTVCTKSAVTQLTEVLNNIDCEPDRYVMVTLPL